MVNRLLGFIEARQWEQAWEEFQRVHTDGPASSRVLLMGSHAAFGLRDLLQARRLAEAALAAYTTSDCPARLLGQVRFHLGMVARELGDSDAALEQFGLFLSELPGRYPDLAAGEGKAYFYRGLTLRQKEKWMDAVVAYDSAIACFRRDGLTQHVCRSLRNQAWALCLLRLPGPARECLMESSKLQGDPEDRIHQTLGEAFLALVEGQPALAGALCETLFRRAEREPLTAAERAHTAWVAARAALALGNGESALALVEIALVHAAEARDARLMADAGALRRQVQLEQTGQVGA